MLKVKKVSGKHLESMGVPSRNGYDLFPEEAVYLVETGSGTIFTPAGAEMSLLEAYSILESNSVSMSKYEIYKQVKLTGLVVLRPRKSTIDFEKVKKVETEMKQKFEEKTSKMLVDVQMAEEDGFRNSESYPSFTTKRGGDVMMRMTVLHTDQSLVSFLPPEILESIPTEKLLQNLRAPTPRPKPCRPPYLPLPNRKVANWMEYNFNAEKTKQAMMLKRFQKLRPPSQAQIRRERITVENVDYHVFSPASFSHRLPARPLFSLICYDVNGPLLKVAELSELRNVIFGVEEAGKVNYVAMSGAMIDLNSYLT